MAFAKAKNPRTKLFETVSPIRTKNEDKPIRMIDIKFVDVLRIRIRDTKFGSRTIRDAYFPQCRSISRRFINEITNLNITTCITLYQHGNIKTLTVPAKFKELQQFAKLRSTWSYSNGKIRSIISNKTRNVCIKVIITGSYVIDQKIAIYVCLGPKLVVLIEK